MLIQADVGAPLAARITEDVRRQARERKASDPAEIRVLLAEELVELFDPGCRSGSDVLSRTPDGVAGSWGERQWEDDDDRQACRRPHLAGRTVSMAAADTFRAAADEQLTIWAERAGAGVVKHQQGADPGAVRSTRSSMRGRDRSMSYSWIPPVACITRRH